MNDEILRQLLHDNEPSPPQANRPKLVESLVRASPITAPLAQGPPTTLQPACKPVANWTRRAAFGLVGLAATLLFLALKLPRPTTPTPDSQPPTALQPTADSGLPLEGAEASLPEFDLLDSQRISQELEDALMASLAVPHELPSAQRLASELRASESLWLASETNFIQRATAAEILTSLYPESPAAQRIRLTSTIP